MAIWQFECNIVPRRDHTENLTQEEVLSWREVSPPVCQIDFIEQEKSWASNVIQYGKADETCLEFVFEDGALEEIECRLDLRNLTKVTLTKLLDYVEENDAMFWVDGEIYPPKTETMVELMKQSEANLFCRNPKEYLLKKNARD